MASQNVINAVGGTLSFNIAGVPYRAKGNFKIGLGELEREGVVGVDGPHGYKVVPKLPFIEGTISDQYNLKVKQFEKIENDSIYITLQNGKGYVLRNAWHSTQLEIDPVEGEVPLKFEGMSMEELLSA